jgi:ribosomal protein S18 acetylase RimI-like enzyme
VSFPSVFTHEEHDIEKLKRVLQQQPVRAAYLLGDLDPPFVHHTKWLVANRGDKIIAILLTYTGLTQPIVLSYGDPDGLRSLLQQRLQEIPSGAYAKISDTHLKVWKEYCSVETLDWLWVMGLGIQRFQPVAGDHQIRLLTKDYPIAELDRVYRDYPGNYFEPSCLEIGVYYGLFVASDLVSIAGTHVVSRSAGVAVLGNIVTTGAHRGKGFAAACTSRLIEHLFTEGCKTIALHVAENNTEAISVYERLGFTFDSRVLQARIWRRTFDINH